MTQESWVALFSALDRWPGHVPDVALVYCLEHLKDWPGHIKRPPPTGWTSAWLEGRHLELLPLTTPGSGSYFQVTHPFGEVTWQEDIWGLEPSGMTMCDVVYTSTELSRLVKALSEADEFGRLDTMYRLDVYYHGVLAASRLLPKRFDDSLLEGLVLIGEVARGPVMCPLVEENELIFEYWLNSERWHWTYTYPEGWHGLIPLDEWFEVPHRLDFYHKIEKGHFYEVEILSDVDWAKCHRWRGVYAP